MLEEADKADGAVGHHEEHGDDFGDRIDVTQGDENEPDGAGHDGGDDGLVIGLPAPLQLHTDGPRKNSVHRQCLQGTGRYDDTAQCARHSRCRQTHRNERRPNGDGLHVELVGRELLGARADPELERYCDVYDDAGHRCPQRALGNGGGRILQVSAQTEAGRDAREGRENEGEDLNERVPIDGPSIPGNELRVDGP